MIQKWIAPVALTICLGVAAPSFASDYAIGADLSFLKQAEERGTLFKDEGQVKPGLQIFKNHGYNWIRLRLFHTPTQLPNNLGYTIALAAEARKLGFKFLLDYHYSDTWADPGKQFIIVVEAAYNWRVAEYQGKDAPFPETPEGQKQFLDEVHRMVMNTPHNRGKGVFWWEPAVPAGRNGRGMFDNEGNALPVITVFDRFARK